MIVVEPLSKAQPLGLAAFGSLRAEDEPWLSQILVSPKNLEQLASDRSVILFGGIGTGKTALYKLLQQQNFSSNGEPQRLLVDWQLTPSYDERNGKLQGVTRQITRLYDLCAVELSAHVADFPHIHASSPEWVSERISWYIHSYLQGDNPERRLMPILSRNKPGSTLLHEILQSEPPQVLYEDAPPDQVFQELCMALEGLGMKGVWVMGDDLERQSTLDEKALCDDLVALLDTLPMFEQANFAFKLFVPARLEQLISSASGVSRRRIDAMRLRWQERELQHMVELRLQAATGNSEFKFSHLCNSPNLLEWLSIVGADSPRHWLDQTKPLVESYIYDQRTEPISKEQWRNIRMDHPPQFYLDEEHQRIIIAGRKFTQEEIPPKAFEMLVHLYHAGPRKYVSRSELYYIPYLGGTHIPRTREDYGYEPKSNYEGLIDTTIYRLRKIIEPEPKHPVLLLTKRGVGVTLNVRW